MGSQGYGYSSFESGCNRSTGGFTTPQKPRSKPSALCVMPCTVSQLHSATENHSGFIVGETELSMVSLVGIVRRVMSSMSSVLYLLDDMTGPPIGVRFWQDSGRDVENCAVLQGTYVKVIGRLRSFENHRSVIGLNLRRLQDLNEITSHILEVIEAHMLIRQAPQNKVNNVLMSSNGTELHPGVKKVKGAASAPAHGFNPIQNEVFNLIKNCSARQGISLWALRNGVTPQYAFHIKHCIQFLTNEGHIYTTIDENHFKATYD